MKTSSSANQLKLDLSEPLTDGDTSPSISPTLPPRAPSAPPMEGELEAPAFGSGSSVYAAAARLAGRLNASAVSKKEHDTLLAERQMLLDKFFDKSITRKESNRLEYVRWQLDRIEDAKYGITLDVIENAVTRYENLLNEIQALRAQLEGRLPKKK